MVHICFRRDYGSNCDHLVLFQDSLKVFGHAGADTEMSISDKFSLMLYVIQIHGSLFLVSLCSILHKGCFSNKKVYISYVNQCR